MAVGVVVWAATALGGAALACGNALSAGVNLIPATLLFLGLDTLVFGLTPRFTAPLVYWLVVAAFRHGDLRSLTPIDVDWDTEVARHATVIGKVEAHPATFDRVRSPDADEDLRLDTPDTAAVATTSGAGARPGKPGRRQEQRHPHPGPEGHRLQAVDRDAPACAVHQHDGDKRHDVEHEDSAGAGPTQAG